MRSGYISNHPASRFIDYGCAVGEFVAAALEQHASSINDPNCNMKTNTLPLEQTIGTRANHRVESGNPSDNQDRSNSSNPLICHNSGPEIWEDDYAALLKAVRSGDWNATRELLMKDHPVALIARILSTGGTVLHAAVEAEQEHIVEALVNMISENDLEMQDELGFTALHWTTIIGNWKMTECLIIKNKRLVRIRDNRNELPVALAMGCGHKQLAHYLYSQTPFEDLVAEEGRHGASLLNRCIYNRDLGIHISLDRAADQFRLNIQNHGQENTNGSVRADLWRQPVSSLLNHLGFKRLNEMELARAQFEQLLSCMSKAVTTLNSSSRNRYIWIIVLAIFHAIRRGNFEFVDRIVTKNSGFFWMRDGAERTIFHRAVLHRQHKIFSLIYSLKQKNIVLNQVDKSKNTILHMVGKLTENTAIDSIRGAALQMQREVQWFKEVKSVCPLSLNEVLNEDGLTAKQLFTRDHQEMRKEGERWMKDTATSCTVVGALIITIMFAAAFTIPGGNNQDTGMPILMHDKLFKLFIVTDSLSLFSSSTSVLMFLGILTSRYAEEDFLKSLPRKMIIGLFALFFSITTMMIAFSAALLLMFRGIYWTVAPIIGLAGIPIILFVLMQSSLLVDMFVSTYGPSIFHRKMKL